MMVHIHVIVPQCVHIDNQLPENRRNALTLYTDYYNNIIISSLTLQNILNFIIVFVFQSKEYVVKGFCLNFSLTVI